MATSRRTIQRFVVIDEIGVGGMGTVYRAHDPQLDRDVAIKVLVAAGEPVRRELSTVQTIDLREGGSAPSADDLLREARMMARLSHPNVVPVYEVGLDGDAMFVVMEHIEGGDLRRWLAAAARRPQEIVALFAQAAHGLAAAHARGIVHRDFKPENVLVGSDGRARVADFGLSRFAQPSTRASLVRVADSGGTPAYMARELWDGAPGTTASDVYAFCTALTEALGDASRTLSPTTRAVIARGLAELPASRPAIEEVIAALEGKGRWVRPVAIGAGLLGVGAVGLAVAFVVGRGEASPACTTDPAFVAGRWDESSRGALRAKFASDAAGVEKVIAALDAGVDKLAQHQRGVCEARQRGELTAQQATKRAACYERRAIALGARARHYAKPSKQIDLATAEELLLATLDASSCTEIDTPPLYPDRPRIETVHGRAVAVTDLPADQIVDELRKIEVEAAAIDEVELEINTALSLGIRLRNLDKLAEASATHQRAHKRAQAIGSSALVAIALVERSSVTGHTGDWDAAIGLAQLAIEQSEKPGTSWRVRVRALRALSIAQLSRGQYADAIATADRALALIAQNGRYAEFEVILRLDRINGLNFVSDRDDEALAYAKETEVRARELAGAESLNYAVALDLLARSYQFAEQPAQAPAYRRKSLEVLQKLYAPDHSRVVVQRAELANDLLYNNELDAAYAEVSGAVQIAREKTALRPKLPYLMSRLAQATWETGRHREALATLQQAVEQMTSLQGLDHPQTQAYRLVILEMRLALGQLDGVERGIVELEGSYRLQPLPADRRPALLRGTLAASVALERGKPADAEAIARGALEELQSLNATPFEQVGVVEALVHALVARARFADAQPLALQALETVQANNARADSIAKHELSIAIVEHGLGNRTAASERAERAASELAKWPGRIVERRRAAALLSKLAHSGSRSPAAGRKP